MSNNTNKINSDFRIGIRHFILPFVLGAAMLIATFFIWHSLLIEENAHIAQLTQLNLVNIRDEVTDHINNHILTLTRMARRWERHGGFERQEWRTDAQSYLKHFKGFQAVAWVDSDFHVRWIEPESGNEPSLDFDILSEETRKAAAELSYDKRQITLTDPVTLASGGRGFLVFVPIFQKDEFKGFILGIFRHKDLFDFILKNAAPGYSIAVFDGSEQIYSNRESGDTYPKKWKREIELNFYGAVWSLRIYPSASEYGQIHSDIPARFLLVGVLLSFLIAFLAYFVEVNILRRKQLALTNTALHQEMLEHKQLDEKIKNLAKFPSEDPNPVIRISKAGIILYANDQGIALLSEWENEIGQSAHEYFKKFVDEAFSYGVKRNAEIKTEDRIFSFAITPVEGKDYVNLYGHDITERKMIEAALKDSEEKYRRLIETSNDAIFLFDAETGIVLEVNKRAQDLMGMLLEEIVGLKYTQIHPEEETRYYQKLFQQVTHSGKATITGEELFLNAKDGRKIPVSVSASLIEIKGEKIIQAVFRDITEQRRIEEIIKDSEVRFRELFNSMSSGVVVYEAIDNGADFVIKDCNWAVERIEKIQKNSIVGKRVTEVFPGVKDFGLLRLLQMVWQSGKAEHLSASLYQDNRISGWRENYVYRLPSGEVVAVYDDVTERKRAEEALEKSREYLEVRVQKRTSELARVNVELQDEIAQRKEMEDKLRREKERIELIYKVTPSGIFTVDKERRIISWNNKAAEITGYSAEEVIGINCRIFSDFPCRDKCGLYNGNTPKPILGGECTIIRKDGQKRVISKNVDILRDPSGDIIGGIESFEDITERKEAERALRVSDDRYLKIIATITDYIYTVRVENDLPVETTYGMGCQAITGYTQEEFISNPYLWIEIVYEQDRKLVEDYASRALKGEKVDPIEHRIVRKDKAIRWVSNTLVPHYGSENKLISYDGIIQDITDRKLVESERARAETLSVIVEGMPDVVLVTDRQAKIVKFNKTLTDYFGYADDVIGKSPMELAVEKDKAKIEEAIKQCFEKGFIRSVEVNILTKYGKEIPVLIDAVTLKDETGNIKYTIAVLTDITERKKLEQLKDEFINIVSHELRTPLASIKEGVNIVLEGLLGKINVEQEDFLKTVKNNINRLTRLVNNILDYQKLDYGRARFEIKEEDLNRLVEQVYKEMSLPASEKGLEFTVDLAQGLPKIIFDSDKIAEVLINLIDNAIKFTDQGRIKISTQKTGNAVQVCVDDTGLGIEKNNIGQLFNVFTQILIPSGVKRGGSGLGLAISKKIIEQHHGKIWIESEFGQGTKVFFTLPIPGPE